ncbi:biotin holocarboxylase synthetase [Thecaphora frezii]
MSNALVYSGPGVSSSALHHTLRTLRTLLPTYDVQTVEAKTLALDPWQQTTSLLVLPGGRDLPYVEELARVHYRSGDAASSSDHGRRAYEQVVDFVRNHGGAFWGICAGAYYASGRCAFELGSPIQVDGDRPFFQFFPGTCSGTVYPGFVYESDRGARIVDLDLVTPYAGPAGIEKGAAAESRWRCHYNGGGAFMDADSFRDRGVEVLARYTTPGIEELELNIELNAGDEPRPAGESPSHQLASKKPIYAGQAAAVLCSVGKGKALLFGTHPEFPLLPSSTAVQLSASKEQVMGSNTQDTEQASRKQRELLRHERRRLDWLRDVFVQRLGLRAELPEWITKADKPKGASPSAGPAQEANEPKLLPVILISTGSGLAAMLDILKQAAAKKQAAALNHLSSDAIPEADLQRDLIASLADSNDTIHLYQGKRETVARLFELCRGASYAAYSKPVLLSNKDPAINGTSAAAKDEVQEQEVDLDNVPKYIACYDDEAELPGTDLLPYWNLAEYRSHRSRFGQAVEQLESQEGNWARWQPSGGMAHFFGGGWAGSGVGGGSGSVDGSSIRIGHTTLYSQMVTSTQTMLDKNFRFLSAFPVGTTFFATQQMSGRGRGGNRWISPKGCLQFSAVFKVPLEMAAKTVFLQYISAMAIVEGIRLALGPSAAGREVADKVRIKWPNDVYAEVPAKADDHDEAPSAGAASDEPRKPKPVARAATFEHGGKRYAKMAGILVNSQFSGGKEFVLISGCGINCLNSRPTTSLRELVEVHNRQRRVAGLEGEVLEEVSQEKLGAAILAVFESMWKAFLRHGGDFGPFVERYRRIWLHSDHEVVVSADALGGDGQRIAAKTDEEAEEGTRVRIVGISSDHGLLRAVRRGSSVTTWDDRAWGPSEQRRTGYDETDEVIELQPDGNSFDMLQNMVRRKA